MVIQPSKGVFLSYASEDARVAKRICDALRDARIEVWFDQSELRGGDAWDRKIRQQIHECRLFMPVISANTEARTEGYFRREWKLAVDRTHDLSERVAFVVPVVIDSTPDLTADVPEAFRQIQWIRLPGGDPSGDFAGHIAALLDSNAREAAPSQRDAPKRALPHRTLRWLIPASGMLLLAATLSWLLLRHYGTGALIAPSAATDRSLAVLPLIDASPKLDQENIAQGIADQVRDLLSKAPGLRVIARASSTHAAKTGQSIEEIARLLGVRYVLDGSVREFSDRLRVTMELNDAARGLKVWSKTFDRDAHDVFAVEDDVARQVGQVLEIVLQSTLPDSASAARLDSYRSYLEGAALLRGGDPRQYQRAAAALRNSVELDPTNAPAWSTLAEVLVIEADSEPATTANSSYETARQAASHAISLAPNDPQGYIKNAHILHDHDWNWQGALAMVQKARDLDPMSPDVSNARGVIAATLGQWQESIDAYREVLTRDPFRRSAYVNLMDVLMCAGRPAEAEAEARRSMEFVPPNEEVTYYLIVSAWAQGEFAQARELAEKWSDPQGKAWLLALVLNSQGARAEAAQQIAQLIKPGTDGSEEDLAKLYVYTDRLDEAFSALDIAYSKHEYGLTNLKCRWQDRPFFHDPRYAQLLQRMNLPN